MNFFTFDHYILCLCYIFIIWRECTNLENLCYTDIINQHYFDTNANQEIDLVDIDVNLYDNDYKLKSAKGVFSTNSIDKGTAVLLDYLKSERGIARLDDLTDSSNTIRMLDIGTGWGVISLYTALLFRDKFLKNALEVRGIDINEHAVKITNMNAKAIGLSNINALTPKDLPDNCEFDLILSNPPIRIGKSATVALLNEYLPHLSSNGIALLVIQKNLGSDSIAKELIALDYECEKLASSKGFRILLIRRKLK